MNYTQSIGNVVELKCLTKFIELGYECSIPYGNGAKYDFVVDINGELLRIQCKSCSHPRRNGVIDTNAIQISTVSQTTNTQKTVRHTYSKKQIDYFATCFNDKVYIIPVEECSTSKTLRFTPPSNNQSQYNKAEDYEITNFFSENDELVKTKQELEERKTNSQNYCLVCNKPISKNSTTGLCGECYKENMKVVQRPSREELKEMIRNIPFVTIGKRYGVTDNTVRKWCRAENLPSRVGDIKKYTDKEWLKV